MQKIALIQEPKPNNHLLDRRFSNLALDSLETRKLWQIWQKLHLSPSRLNYLEGAHHRRVNYIL